MVTTRSHTVGLLYEKGVRLRNKLKKLGILKGQLPVSIHFGAAVPSLVTRKTVWLKFMNPTSIVFKRLIEGVVYNVAFGCIHSLDARCPACDFHPDADVKDDDIFGKTRAWKACLLWNKDKYVLGEEDEAGNNILPV